MRRVWCVYVCFMCHIPCQSFHLIIINNKLFVYVQFMHNMNNYFSFIFLKCSICHHHYIESMTNQRRAVQRYIATCDHKHHFFFHFESRAKTRPDAPNRSTARYWPRLPSRTHRINAMSLYIPLFTVTGDGSFVKYRKTVGNNNWWLF